LPESAFTADDWEIVKTAKREVFENCHIEIGNSVVYIEDKDTRMPFTHIHHAPEKAKVTIEWEEWTGLSYSTMTSILYVTNATGRETLRHGDMIIDVGYV
jgi:hypothetical protein